MLENESLHVMGQGAMILGLKSVVWNLDILLLVLEK